MSNNNTMVPEAQDAMNRFKMDAANEVGVNLKQGYNGDLTSKQAGSIGGQMVKKMIKSYEESMKYSLFSAGRPETGALFFCPALPARRRGCFRRGALLVILDALVRLGERLHADAGGEQRAVGLRQQGERRVDGVNGARLAVFENGDAVFKGADRIEIGGILNIS